MVGSRTLRLFTAFTSFAGPGRPERAINRFDDMRMKERVSRAMNFCIGEPHRLLTSIPGGGASSIVPRNRGRIHGDIFNIRNVDFAHKDLGTQAKSAWKQGCVSLHYGIINVKLTFLW